MAQQDFPQAELDFIADKVTRRVFLEKLARDWNVVPQNVHEEDRLFHIAEQLQLAEEHDRVKSASDGNSFLDAAAADLDGVLVRLNYLGGGNRRLEFAKQAAAAAMQHDPDLARASLTVAGHLAASQAAA